MAVISSDALGRPEFVLPLPDLAGVSVVVTGAGGFIGERVSTLLGKLGADVLACEPPNGSVLEPASLPDADWCLHLAGHKYATSAEDDPADITELNVRGTANVAARYGNRLVLASTCKAADPMTAYGASKLIAERVALNAGGRVVRFVNVLGSVGSVAQMWADTPDDEPLTVMDCQRMWMSPAEAVRLMVAAMGWPSGRYALDVPEPEAVHEMASRLFPNRELVWAPVRRGDRVRERLVAEAERREPWIPGAVRIIHPFDTQ